MLPAVALLLLASVPFEEIGARVTVLVFVRTDCPVSNRLAPEVVRLSRTFGPKVAFWLVYPMDSDAAIERHRRDFALPLPALADPLRTYTRLAGATVTPEAAVFTAGRKLLYRGRIDDSQITLQARRPAAAQPDLEIAIRRALSGQATKTRKAIGCAIPRAPVAYHDDMNRRDFSGLALASLAAQAAPAVPQQWRNKQAGMHYRQLGRTGMMVSEVVSGGDPITVNNFQHLELALEMGLNYLDMAPAYNNGSTEMAYGKLIAKGSRRANVFLTTKTSGLQAIRNRMYKQIYDGLPAARQEALQKRAADMMAESFVMKPGYFLDYYPGIRNQPGPAYLSNAMAKDYGHQVDGKKEFRDFIIKTLEGSLQRVGTDHFDLLMCPHGACCPQELDIPEIYETFLGLKKAGKVRYLGVTSHTDPAGVLRKATELGYYDAVMCAYNVVNGGYVEEALKQAAAKGIGVIAMKAAMSVATHHKSLQPVPQWRIDKVNRVVPGDLKAPLKAYTWALQNPNLTAVISNLWDETHIRENLSVAGKKVDLQPA